MTANVSSQPLSRSLASSSIHLLPSPQTQECNAAAALRHSDRLSFADITFALRNDPVRLARLTQFARLRNVTAKAVRKLKSAAVDRSWQAGSWDLIDSLNSMTPEQPVRYAKVVVLFVA